VVRNAHEVVAAWAAAEAREWPQFGDLLSERTMYEAPQTRKRVRELDRTHRRR
jgi:hypothetical protein